MKKILGILAAIVMGFGMVPVNASAIDNTAILGVETVILNECDSAADGPNGEGVMCVLGVGVNILTAAVGIIGVLGIVIVGIQYLTAGGNEEQTRKAKRRMLEIVIGLVLYVSIFALLKWLLPGFKK